MNKIVRLVLLFLFLAAIVLAIFLGGAAAKDDTGEDPGADKAAGSAAVFEPASMTACNAALALKQLGLFEGVSDRDFDLLRVPNREEALAMLIRMLGSKDEALSADREHPFTDVDPWADRYVGYAYENGLSDGVSDTLFGSAADVRDYEYITFLLRAFGYTSGEDGDFDWQAPYELAKEIGLLPADYASGEFRRAELVELSWRALYVQMKDGGGTLIAKLCSAGAVSAEDIEICGLCAAAGIETEEEHEFVPPAVGADLYPHTPAPANCQEQLVCAVCGEALPGKGEHVPGKVSCIADQVCTVCGEVLQEAAGHSYTASSDGLQLVCDRCGQTVNLKASTKNQTLIDENVPEGHFHNNINAYYSGSVLVCGDYGLEYFKSSSAGSKTYADMVRKFAEKYPDLNVTCLITPKACAFYPPAGYDDVFQNQVNFISATYDMMGDSVNKADCIGVMAEHKGEYMFYRTDHHWTSLGAYYASVAYCQANGITPRALSDYKTVVNTGFIGTLYSYASKPACLAANPDYTVAHLPAASYTMTYKTGGSTGKGVAINTSVNSYASMFICGDQAFEDIKTDNNTGRKLIIFKESYGNAFAPYMIDYYDEIIVIDIRKDTASINKIIEDYGITDALIINNIQAVSSLNGYLSKKLAS